MKKTLTLTQIKNDEYGSSKTIEGYVAKLDNNNSPTFDVVGMSFIGVVDNRCVFIKKDSLLDVPSPQFMDSLQCQLENRINGGTAFNFVETIRYRMYNEQEWIQKILDRLNTNELKKAQNELAQVQTALSSELLRLKTEIEQKSTVLNRINYLAQELGYQKQFVDTHPF